MKYLTTMENRSGLFTRWFQELAGFNFYVDALSLSAHMAEALPLEDDKYAEFFKVDKPVIKFEGRVNKIQHVQHSTAEIAEEQAKDEV